ncbi:MAG: hypothetical protein Q9P01_22520 [Anaerolineae bacterium]|nr:hypothetical protein [Anaerolineae bacterium]
MGTRLFAIFIDGIILSIITGLLFGSVEHRAWIIGFALTLGYNCFFPLTLFLKLRNNKHSNQYILYGLRRTGVILCCS